MSNAVPQTLPKTTMIGLNYWNATTKTSNCDFESVLEEPLTLNRGDFCQVRNSFLDASKLNSEVVIIEEDTTLEMDIMFYAMIKKTSCNFGSFENADLNTSTGWVYGASVSKYERGLDNLPKFTTTGIPYFPEFNNPLLNYAEIAMAGYWKRNQSGAGDADITKTRWAQNFGGWAYQKYENGATAPLLVRNNVNTSLPTNKKAINQPVFLMETNDQVPYIRTISFVLPKGTYSREELAVKITSLMSTQTPQQNLINTTDQMGVGSTGLNNVVVANLEDYNGVQGKGYIYPYKTRADTATNPFQASIRFGYVSASKSTDFPPPLQPPDIFNYEFSSNQVGVSIGPIQEEAIADSTFIYEMGANMVGFCDEIGLQPDMPSKLAVINKQVAFTPLCKDFRILDGTCNEPSGAMYDYPQIDDEGFANFETTFDTQIPFNVFEDYNLGNDTRTNSYNCGDLNSMQFLPYVFNTAQTSLDNLTGGMFGANEISITYNDNNSSKYSFNFLHTPIEMGVDATSGSVPVVVKQISDFSIDFRSDLSPPSIDSQLRNTSYVDRHSGVLFTDLRATQTGKPYDFWSGVLGFNLEDILYPIPKGTFYQGAGYNLIVNPTLLSYNDFMKKTTGQIFGISFQTDPRMICVNNNNELLNVQDFFSEGTLLAGFNDTIIESEQASALTAINLPSSALSQLGGSILIEITGFSTGDLQDGKDSFAVKSIISLYYLSDNSYISSEIDPYIYYHTSSIQQKISKLRVRFLNPITKKVIPDTLLGRNNSLFLAITQNVKLM